MTNLCCLFPKAHITVVGLNRFYLAGLRDKMALWIGKVADSVEK